MIDLPEIFMDVKLESLDCLMYCGLCRARGRSTTLWRSTISALLVMIISMRSMTMSRSEVTEEEEVSGAWLEVEEVAGAAGNKNTNFVKKTDINKNVLVIFFKFCIYSTFLSVRSVTRI